MKGPFDPFYWSNYSDILGFPNEKGPENYRVSFRWSNIAQTMGSFPWNTFAGSISDNDQFMPEILFHSDNSHVVASFLGSFYPSPGHALPSTRRSRRRSLP